MSNHLFYQPRVELAGVEALVKKFGGLLTPAGEIGELIDVVIERIVADIIKPGVPEVRECSEVADELRRYRPSLVRLLAIRALAVFPSDVAGLVNELEQANFDEGQVYERDGDVSPAKSAAEDKVVAARSRLDAALAARDRELAALRRSGGVSDELRAKFDCAIRAGGPSPEWREFEAVAVRFAEDLCRADIQARARIAAEDRARAASGAQGGEAE